MLFVSFSNIRQHLHTPSEIHDITIREWHVVTAPPSHTQLNQDAYTQTDLPHTITKGRLYSHSVNGDALS